MSRRRAGDQASITSTLSHWVGDFEVATGGGVWVAAGVQNLQELRSPHKNFREALRADLLVLRQQLKEIADQSKVTASARQHHPPPGLSPVVPPVKRAATLGTLQAEIKQELASLTKLSQFGDEEGPAPRPGGRIRPQAHFSFGKHSASCSRARHRAIDIDE